MPNNSGGAARSQPLTPGWSFAERSRLSRAARLCPLDGAVELKKTGALARLGPAFRIGWAFGFGWFHGWRESYYQVDNIETLRLKDYYHSFVEWKPDPGFTLRAELNNLDPFSFNIERQIYAGRRDQFPLATIETERRNSQIMGMLSARWTFN